MTERDEGATDWDARRYESGHSFVYEYGTDVLDLLDPDSGERVLDLGCGMGHLTNEIRERGAAVVGLDSSAEMLAEARAAHPECRFVRADARTFKVRTPFDAVFSNATLHWIPERSHDELLQSVADALVPGGRFVAEFGGAGNVQSITDAVERALSERGYEITHSWYFPTIGEYATRLEANGFEVRYATLFDRPTELDTGSDGLASWLRMFGEHFFEPLSTDERASVLRAVEDDLREEQFVDGTWIADYRRLRFVARRSSD